MTNKKNIIVVESKDLILPFDHQSNFKAINFTIWLNFSAVNPTTTNNLIYMEEELSTIYH